MGITSQHDLKHLVGNVLFFLLALVIILDPTNSILHLKDKFFVLLVAYNMVAFRPDFSKLPHILLIVSVITLCWILGMMGGERIEMEEALAVYKAVSPLILLLWIREYDVISLCKFPVVVAGIIVVVLYVLLVNNPTLEYAVYLYMEAHDKTIGVTRRAVLGVELFGLYYKSTVTFFFVFVYYLYKCFYKNTRTLKRVVIVLLLLWTFCVSGTRSTMMVPFFLFCVVGYRTFRNSKYGRYLMYPILFCVGSLFVVLVFRMMMETDEASNVVKYAHVHSYLKLFNEHPYYFLIGQGPGALFYSEGFHRYTTITEWSYLELIRCYGVFSLPILLVFVLPLPTLYRSGNEYAQCILGAYVAYLFIAGTNPLLLSSTGMIVLLMAYSFESRLKQSTPVAPQAGGLASNGAE